MRGGHQGHQRRAKCWHCTLATNRGKKARQSLATCAQRASSPTAWLGQAGGRILSREWARSAQTAPVQAGNAEAAHNSHRHPRQPSGSPAGNARFDEQDLSAEGGRSEQMAVLSTSSPTPQLTPISSFSSDSFSPHPPRPCPFPKPRPFWIAPTCSRPTWQPSWASDAALALAVTVTVKAKP